MSTAVLCFHIITHRTAGFPGQNIGQECISSISKWPWMRSSPKPFLHRQSAVTHEVCSEIWPPWGAETPFIGRAPLNHFWTCKCTSICQGDLKIWTRTMWREARRVWQWRNQRVQRWGRDIRGQKVSGWDNAETAPRRPHVYHPACCGANFWKLLPLSKQSWVIITRQHINTTPSACNTYLHLFSVWHLLNQQVHCDGLDRQRLSLCSISSTLHMFKDLVGDV